MIDVTTLTQAERTKLMRDLEKYHAEATNTFTVTIKVVVKEDRTDDFAYSDTIGTAISEMILTTMNPQGPEYVEVVGVST